jgi:hypothetical protein
MQSNPSGAPEMSTCSPLFCADALLRLCRAVPRRPGEEAFPANLALARLQLRATALLPTHGANGLGPSQQAVVAAAVDAAVTGVTRALQTPRTHLTLAQIALLRGLARGSSACEREAAFSAKGHCLPHEFRTHRHATYTVLKSFADGLVFAEIAYDALLAGAETLRSLATPPFFEALDGALDLLALCNVAWMVPVLFDGLRLRGGLAVATGCATGVAPEDDGSDATACTEVAEPGGAGYARVLTGDPVAERLLSDGERVVDCDRVLAAALFFLASARGALEAYESPTPYKECRQGTGPPDDDPAYHWRNLEADIRLGLEKCREESENRGLHPGKAMRVVLDAFAVVLEFSVICSGACLLLRLGFAFPCLVPSGLKSLKGYDGGLLSVWDACLHLLELHATLHNEVLPLHTLACAVLGGVVGNLLAPTELAGPFVLHPDSEVAAWIKRLRASWPDRKTRTPILQRGSGAGKMVGANAVITEAVATGHFRAQHSVSAQGDARFDAAMTMRVLAEGIGGDASHTTDGVAPLRRLYIAALHFEPAMPEGPTISEPCGPTLEASALSPTMAGCLPFCVPPEQVDTVWRDVTGAALLLNSSLFCFTRRAFADLLEEEWTPTDAMQQALRARELEAPNRSAPVMHSSTAAVGVVQRVRAHVLATIGVVDKVVLSTDGPRYVTRAVESLGVWARAACHVHCASGSLWEAFVIGLCPSLKRKHR